MQQRARSARHGELGAGDLRVGVEDEESHSARRDDRALVVADDDLPELRAPPAGNGRRRRMKRPVTNGADERCVVLEPDDVLTCGHRVERGADRRERLDDACVDASVDDPLRLAMARPNLDRGGDLVTRRRDDDEPELPRPGALVHAIDGVRRVEGAHGRNSSEFPMPANCDRARLSTAKADALMPSPEATCSVPYGDGPRLAAPSRQCSEPVAARTAWASSWRPTSPPFAVRRHRAPLPAHKSAPSTIK